MKTVFEKLYFGFFYLVGLAIAVVGAAAIFHLVLLIPALAIAQAFGGRFLIFPDHPWVTYALISLPLVVPCTILVWRILVDNVFFLHLFVKEEKKEPIRYTRTLKDAINAERRIGN